MQASSTYIGVGRAAGLAGREVDDIVCSTHWLIHRGGAVTASSAVRVEGGSIWPVVGTANKVVRN